ncbi:MAG: N,N-dimethylformamidase beta subunit family domain-containing protein [Ilumatobacteraceae bacterium]
MADDVTHYDAVEAYCGQLSYLPGEGVALHAWCATDRFDVDVRRWGGATPGNDEVLWSQRDVPGVAHPTPVNADSHGCGWPVALTIPIGSDWASGMYLVTLHAHGAAHERAIGHAMFVVRAKRATGNPLLVIATNTYNAYNNWGGRSLYTGGHQVSFDRPFGRGMLVRPHTERDDRKSRPVHPGEDPDVDGVVYQQYRFAHGYPGYMSSAGWFTYERRFAEWAVRNGTTLDYAVSSDLEFEPAVVDGYRLVLGVGHDEYWSAAQRDTIEAHVAGGGNYASLSGNTMFWQVRLGDHDGDHVGGRGGGRGRMMTAYKYSAHRNDPVVGTAGEHLMTGMWCDPFVARPEWRFLGAGSAFGLYSRFGQATPRASGGFTVYRDDHWLFEGTGLRYGDQLGASSGAVGYETVGVQLGFDDYGLPVARQADAAAHTEVVAFAPASNLAEGEYPASVAASADQCDLEFLAERRYGDTSADSLRRVRHGNAVMLTCQPSGPSGGTVATIGSTDWVYALDDAAVSQITANVVRHLNG